MIDSDNYENYYNKFYREERKLAKQEKKRINDIINMLPPNMNSLLEVGCGDGRIINQLIEKYKTIYGIDISKNALKYVKTPKKQGNIENLPFLDNSFDIVMCCEVLEHLPLSVYSKALKELERVSKKYILISVPNNENLNLGMIECPQCGCSFHTCRHLRSFNQDKLKNLFTNFEVYKIDYSLFDYKTYPDFIIKTYEFIKKSKISISDFPDALCPQCGYFLDKPIKSKQYPNENNSMNKILKRLFSVKRKSGWLMVLYKHWD